MIKETFLRELPRSEFARDHKKYYLKFEDILKRSQEFFIGSMNFSYISRKSLHAISAYKGSNIIISHLPSFSDILLFTFIINPKRTAWKKHLQAASIFGVLFERRDKCIIPYLIGMDAADDDYIREMTYPFFDISLDLTGIHISKTKKYNLSYIDLFSFRDALQEEVVFAVCFLLDLFSGRRCIYSPSMRCCVFEDLIARDVFLPRQFVEDCKNDHSYVEYKDFPMFS